MAVKVAAQKAHDSGMVKVMQYVASSGSRELLRQVFPLQYFVTIWFVKSLDNKLITSMPKAL